MKKYIILATAALAALAACTKTEIAPEAQKVISFEVANSLTKATGVKYENGAFGTYAWFNNTDDFMVNETVDKVGGVWKTSINTYYWPKTGSISFISYSPFSGTNNTANSNPAVTKNSITYTGVVAGSTDLMYADRATCSSNVNEVTDSDSADSGFSGVPTVFRHALAKLSFKIKASFLTYTDNTTSPSNTTTWEVTVNSAKIKGFRTTGDCALSLNTDGKSWNKPVTTVGSVDYNVWTNLSGATTAQELVASPIVLTTTAEDIAPATGYVMPQVLESGIQQIVLNVHIKTSLPNGKTIEEDFTPTIDIKDISSLKAWQMNENIVYTISIKPTSSADPSNPHMDDPTDVTITFDPAVADWTTVDAAATILL